VARRRGFSSIRGDAERIGRRLVEGFRENRLLTHASEIAFQVISSIVPLALLAVAVFGFLDLSEIWRRDLAPRIQEEVSPAGFAVIDSTIESVLGSRQTLWLTIGAALTCWEVSGAVRAIMGTLNDVDGVREQRPFRRRLLVSGALAIALLVCMLGAVLSVMLVGRVVDASGVLGVLLGLGRWVLAVLLLAVALTLLLRFGPT
jgi:YihY family inner membrane protein